MLYRPAQEADALRLKQIYAPYVANTAITFADVPLEPEDFVHKMHTPYPILVCEEEGRVLCYAYAAKLREKAAYRWVVELSIYVDEACQGRGIGKGLMARLLALLKAQGYQSAYSCITLPNEKSLSLHRAFGFRQVGHFEKAGYKLGAWRDVVWLCLPLNDMNENPSEPLPFHALDEDLIQSLLQ